MTTGLVQDVQVRSYTSTVVPTVHTSAFVSETYVGWGVFFTPWTDKSANVDRAPD